MPEILRIGDKKIDVAAVPVIDPQHEHRAAAEGPHRLVDHCGEMVREGKRGFEQRRPRARPGQVG